MVGLACQGLPPAGPVLTALPVEALQKHLQSTTVCDWGCISLQQGGSHPHVSAAIDVDTGSPPHGAMTGAAAKSNTCCLPAVAQELLACQVRYSHLQPVQGAAADT